MKNKYVIIGYYICEYTFSPSFLNDVFEKNISISECLCDHEPRIFLCHGWKPNGDKQEYINYFSSKETYIKMSEEIMGLFIEDLFDEDGRFLRKENALYFYKEYFNDSKHILVSVCAKEEYIKLLGDDFNIEKNPVNEIDGNIIGYDIIGWERGSRSFHSFLCNSLEKQFPDVKFNSYGLLDETYCKTEQMSLSIQGMGEPVDWIPVILHKIEI